MSNRVLSCSNCTVSAKEPKEGIVFECACGRFYCGHCVGTIWRESKWKKVCKVCQAVDYLREKGFTVKENEQGKGT